MRLFVIWAVVVVAAVFAAGDEVSGHAQLLSPSMRCSACEVVSSLIFNYSSSLGFAQPPADGLAQLADTECPTLRSRYKLAQQAFAAHLKLFVPVATIFDMVMYEPPEFYTSEEHDLARTSLRGLAEMCTVMLVDDSSAATAAVKELADSEHVTAEFFSKRFCRVLRGECADSVLAAERTKALAQRRAWKKLPKKHRMDQTASRTLHNDDL